MKRSDFFGSHTRNGITCLIQQDDWQVQMGILNAETNLIDNESYEFQEGFEQKTIDDRIDSWNAFWRDLDKA